MDPIAGDSTVDLNAAMSTSPKRQRRTATALPLPPGTQPGPPQNSDPSQQQHTAQQFAPQSQTQQLQQSQQQMPQMQPRTELPQQSPGDVHFGSESPVPAGSGFYPNPYRDGRVRNPVPSNLRGRADPHGGSFGVMHIDINTAEAKARDEIAKRTSERTERAAKMAQQAGYVPLSRRRFPHLPTSPTVPNGSRTAMLDPNQTKEEQARLLTLLRSLNPVSVVDQICKALAYFGGIPGAPAPPDGNFPESADRNGSGRLFVGWISEIFPHIENNTPSITMSPAKSYAQLNEATGDAPAPESKESVKRPRGRPKGSKATKARKDKGIKKGMNKAKSMAAAGVPSGAGEQNAADVDGSWVDMDESTMDATAAPGAMPPDMSLPLGEHPPYAPKKRGRPKGSKNRPKEPAPEGAEQAGGEWGSQNPTPKTKSKGKKSKSAATAQSDGGPLPGINGNGQDESTPSGVEFALAALQSYNDTSSMAGEQSTSFTPANLAPSAHVAQQPNATPANKRKRNTAKTTADGTQDLQPGSNAGRMQRSPLPNGFTPQGSGTAPVLAQPPAKRQRKAKEPSSMPEPTAAVQVPANDATSEASDGHFDRETFEALQSQLEQETEPVRRQEETQMQAMLPQLRAQGQQQSSQLQGIAGRQPDQRQQQQQSVSPHHQQQQQQQHQQQHMASTQISGAVQAPQQQRQPSRNTSQSYFTQMGNGSASYGQHSPQSQQQQQQQQQQQSSQPQQQPQTQQHTAQFPAQQTQQHATQFPSQQTHQHYSATPPQQQVQQTQQQQPKYSTGYQPQTSYSVTQAQQPQQPQQPQQQQQQQPQQQQPQQPQQQQYPASQQRHQQVVATNSPVLVTQASTSDTGYRTANNAAMGYNAQFNSQQRTQASASPSVNAYTPNRTPSFGATAARQQQQQQQQQAQQQQPQTQQSQGNVAASMQSFHNFDANNAALFENMGLDGSGHASLGLGTPSYNMSGGVARSSAGTANFGPAFDSLQGNNLRDRYYGGGVRR
ncbi:hypothetical protein MAPG_08293 [Magnaporthiopsis poae ATCC 64411]|uniref:Uncharacterized protein n=1 Tax=Magnaporthiopsis poae (strain ATCC 64411 / 73-15) TaxID=644358 RepID=A0A0C4E6Z3_MAGP6|nr:hypothetical protein MAPG_08293 [Magnaporthiopsis poae ATCC 64411]